MYPQCYDNAEVEEVDLVEVEEVDFVKGREVEGARGGSGLWESAGVPRDGQQVYGLGEGGDKGENVARVRVRVGRGGGDRSH